MKNIARHIFILCTVAIVGCTFVNEQKYQVGYNSQVAPAEIMVGIENYFEKIGFQLNRKTKIIYPNEKLFARYYLGEKEIPVFYHSYDYVILSLENNRDLYITWMRISSHKETPPPGYFDKFYNSIATDLKSQLDVEVHFKLVEAE